jgi:hypothetical protein
MKGSHVVVWDPEGDHWEGSVVDGANAPVLRARGAALLPCDPDLFRRSGVGGYMRRGWGAGWPLDHSPARLICPLTLWLTPVYRVLHWCARLLPDPRRIAEAQEKGLPDLMGFVRLAADSTQGQAHQAAVGAVAQPVDGARLGRADKRGGWIVGGETRISPASDGHFGFALYGTMPGARIAWAALSVVEG